MRISSLCTLSLLLAAVTRPLVLIGQNAAADRPGADEVVSGKLGNVLDVYLQRASAAGFSGVVLVARDGKVILHRAYGWADRIHDVRNTTGTVFDIGSVTKVFDASLVGLLVSEGRLRLGDSLPHFFTGVPPDKRGITVRDLLTHTAGLGNTNAAESLDREAAIQRILESPLVHPIGAQWDYSNDGYALLKFIVETVTGSPFEEMVESRLFMPTGMVNTGFPHGRMHWRDVTLAHGQNLLTDYGSAATSSRGGIRHRSALSTSGDLYRWAVTWLNARLLPQWIEDSMTVPRVPVVEGVDYGYGWFIQDSPGGRALRYGGNSTPVGFTSELKLFPSSRTVLIILNNSMWDATPFIRRVRAGVESILFGGAIHFPPPVLGTSSVLQQRVVGTYRVPTGGRIDVWLSGGALLVGVEGQDAVDLIFPPDTQEVARRRRANERTATLVDSAWRGHADVGPRSEILDLERQSGAVLGVDVLGSAPTSPEDDGTDATYVRLRFRDRAETLRLVWNDEHLMMTLSGTPRPVLPLLLQPDGSFMAYDFFSDRGVALRLRGTADMTTLLVGDSAHAVRVEKMP